MARRKKEAAGLKYFTFRNPKKTGKWWFDVRVNGHRYRESLGTRDEGEANELLLKRVEQLKIKTPDTAKRSKTFGSMTVSEAILAYMTERQLQVSPKTVAYWKNQGAALVQHFTTIKLKAITPADLTDYQIKRSKDPNKNSKKKGIAPKTINGELSILRQLLTHAKYWDRFEGEYKKIKNDKKPVGLALTDEEQQRLFEVAQSKSLWLYAYTAGVLGAFCGMRSHEIKMLQWQHIDFVGGVLDIRKSKTPAGWRAPTLNSICKEALTALHDKAVLLNATNLEHFIFPFHVAGGRKIDPTRAITSWRTAWRSIKRTAAHNDEGELIHPNLMKVRFHDLRHTAVTVLAEAGMSDQTIMAQVGHISKEMLDHYSHIRRKMLNEAAAALEPAFLKRKETDESAELIN